MNQAESLQLTQKSPASRLEHHTIQPKLKIGQPNDKYEQEADRLADQVMRMPDPQLQMRSKDDEKKERPKMQPLKGNESLQMKSQVPGIQRMCPRCQKRAKQGKPLNCPECEKKLQMKPAIQKKSNGQTYAPQGISSQLSASKGRGTSLLTGTQQEMSHKMGADFSGVNIHTGSNSNQLNQQLGAKAFTHGQDIYFNKGEYNPSSNSGKRLLAHELTHVRQQGGDEIRPYRPKNAYNFGKGNSGSLIEKEFTSYKKQPWIKKVKVKLVGTKKDKYGRDMWYGTLEARYYSNKKAMANISANVTAGSKSVGMTDKANHLVHRIEGIGYNSSSYSNDFDGVGPRDRYSKIDNKGKLKANMHYAVFYKGAEALHIGPDDESSHGCIHVADWNVMQQLNYHSVKGKTAVEVTYP